MIWNTPVPQIILAIEGKYDFAIKTNPFGAPKDPEKEAERKAKIEDQRAKLALIKLEARQKAKGK